MGLILSFDGWCMIRLATDPDPSDEPRGVSGYTFAFAGERDLDRIVRFQPPRSLRRSHSPDFGVKVSQAVCTEKGKIASLRGARVDLEGEPKLENRNWTLTLPGKEPIFPFQLRINKGGLRISRDAPLDPDNPSQPIWEASNDALAAQGAAGINYEPQTVGHATGIWDSLAEVKKRLALLKGDLDKLQDDGKGESTAAQALRGRIAELERAVDNPRDRRVTVRYFVERFAFDIAGSPAEVVVPTGVLGGEPDTVSPWSVAFWMGAWDPDTLSAFVQGRLEIPYVQSTGASTAN